MNYLAHIYLSGPDPDVQVGGLLGDFVKGPLTDDWPPALHAGIRLHRRIDTMTDAHPAFLAARASLPRPWRRFGGILLDIYFDHLLAGDWSRYHSRPLDGFCRDFYHHLHSHRDALPPRARQFCTVAPQVQWLEGYARAERLPTMLDKVGQRLRRPVPLGEAWPLLQQRRSELEQTFAILIHEQRRLAADFLEPPSGETP